MKAILTACTMLVLISNMPVMAQHKKIAMSALPAVNLVTVPGDLVTTIEFQVKAAGEDVQVFAKGIIPWVNLGKADLELRRMLNGAELVLPYNKITVMTSFPQVTSFVIRSTNEKGFSRSALVTALSDKIARFSTAHPDTTLNLSTADVYETESGQITLRLEIAP